MVGEAFARPLCDELERNPRDVRSLQAIVTGGAAMSAGTKARLLELVPGALVLDSGGASETGPQLSNVSATGGEPTSGLFSPSPLDARPRRGAPSDPRRPATRASDGWPTTGRSRSAT